MQIFRHWISSTLLLRITAGAVLCLGGLHTMADEPGTSAPIRVAIYDDVGGNAKGPTNCERCLPQAHGFVTTRLKAADIRSGDLANFDVLIQPGGTGSAQARTLEQPGRDAIRRFVDQGGGYVGICAGAYLASADYEWSLGLLDAKVLDRKHWARGKGDVKVRLGSQGRQFLSEKEEVVTIHYAQGPLLAPAGKPDIPDYKQLAIFETEMTKNGAPEGVMKGTTAAALGTFGQGRVFCFSPHPEQTPGLDHYIEAAVRWAAESKPTLNSK